MAEYTLKYINHRAECNAEAFVNDCEEHYHRQLHLVADQIAANCKRKPVVLLNGPSSSGKTTTNDRLGRILELAGIHTHMISMDDYYRTSGTYDIPFDEENGVNDLESPECMDLDLLRDHLTRLVAGEEIMVPRFDFETRTSHRNERAVQLHKDEIVMIEGIHAFNPVIMGDLEKHATSVYLSVASVLLTDHNVRVEPHNEHLSLGRECARSAEGAAPGAVHAALSAPRDARQPVPQLAGGAHLKAVELGAERRETVYFAVPRAG